MSRFRALRSEVTDEELAAGESEAALEAALDDDDAAEPASEDAPPERARLRLAALLLEFSDNVEHAKEHLERAVRTCALCTAIVLLATRGATLLALIGAPRPCCCLRAQQVVVLPLPSCDELKCRVFGTLASCYAALRTKPKELKAALRKGHDLAVANRKKQAPGARCAACLRARCRRRAC